MEPKKESTKKSATLQKITELEKEEVFICDCHSNEHMMVLWYDDESNWIHATVHLSTYQNFFKRLWVGLKYAFGYRCRFGEWDNFIFKARDTKRAISYFNKVQYPVKRFKAEKK